MCGIIAIARQPGAREVPDAGEVLDALQQALGELTAIEGPIDAVAGVERSLRTTAERLQHANALLLGPAGVRLLLDDRGLATRVEVLAGEIRRALQATESELDRHAPAGAALEAVNAALVRARDAAWAVERDRVRTARGVADLAGGDLSSWSGVEVLTSVQQALSALDRLEVRGRDSAGLAVVVRDHGLSFDDPVVGALLAPRDGDPLFRTGAARNPEGHLVLVYKAAAEVGELGDNTRALREAIRADELLRLALEGDDATAIVLAHTRWASVGIISQPNAHPLDSREPALPDGPFVVAALNGDVDNYADLKATEGVEPAPEITTDAKVIPTLVSRRLARGATPLEAFRASVASFEGSVAIAASAACDPSSLLLALRGSGQALYVGLADDAFVVASEVYGLVELTPRYVRLDGEAPASAESPTTSRGQVVRLDGTRAGTLEGVERIAYDGTSLPLSGAEVQTAQITTRDIDRGDFPHYLLKEITEAPASFRKTLRGKLVEDADDRLRVALGDDVLPPAVRAGLRSGAIRHVAVIGQGTAHVAAMSLTTMLRTFAAGSALRIEALPATELSGFGLRADMDDTLVVAISQSGTTTDTNRTVDLVRGRGGHVVAVVNRRNSDLTDKADGVLYTSDGRDVEMSVASTKAFYAQVAAGCLLAVAVAEEVGGEVDQALLRALRALPDAMAATVERRPAIAAAAHDLAPSRRYWAVVGNGTNRIAAEELRIKLSELCYKSVACDATEDKKHIDLSSEPLVVVCATGLSGSNADDVAKEIAIYRAHKAAPVVFATDGERRFTAALHAVSVPETHPQLAFVLAAVAGHLFGYEAALAIDAQAKPLRQARAAIEAVVADLGTGRSGDDLLARLRQPFEPLARTFFDGLRTGAYDGHLEASTAVRLATLLRYVLGVVPLESYQVDEGKVGTPAVVVEDLIVVLTQAIEELTRPIDAIKHQAKTVTVGISRTDETLLQQPLVQAVLAAGAPRDRLSYKTLRALADLDPAVEEVTGWIRYELDGTERDGAFSAVVVDRGGIARDIPSRTERTGVLRGTKHTVALERQVFVTRGRKDGRTLVIVPEVKDNETTGITLLHVRFRDRLSAAAARSVLQGYRSRYAPLVDAVLETEPTFREDRLGEVPVVDLLVEPIRVLADRWRS